MEQDVKNMRKMGAFLGKKEGGGKKKRKHSSDNSPPK